MKESKKAIISNEVYEAIKGKILRMELKSGEPLVEEDLAREFDVSRTPIRDALKRLEHDGFVTIIPYRGSVVREITEGDIVEIYTIRQALESICVKNAVPIISEANIRQMEDDWEKSIEEFESKD
ncbi:GntR family transcriptional regulator, partial [Enterocloster bolteae]